MKIFLQDTETPPMQTPCQYCHQPTKKVFRNTRKKSLNNLISSCQDCAADKPYLSISLIFK